MPRECAVTKAYKLLDKGSQESFQHFVTGKISSGVLAQALTSLTKVTVDHMAVDHFRRKLRNGKMSFEQLG